MHIVDLIVFLVFTCGVMLLGCSFFKKKTSSDEFTSAGRSLPGWVVGMSIFATYVSSISYLGNPGMAFAGDWNAFVFSLSIPVASYFAAKYFVPFYRNMGSVSAYSFLEERFGPWARMYASMCYLLTQIARMGSILFLLALPMNSLMGWNIPLVIVVTSIAIIVYSMMGGMKGVIWTEAMQGFILIGGAVVCLFVLLFKMPEGPMQTFEIAMQDNKFYLGDLTTNIDTSTLWVCLIYGLFINLQNYGIDQNYVQRYLTAKSEREAKFSALFGGYLYIPVSAVFFLIGTALYAYYKVYPDLLPADIAQKADYVFPYFIVHELPVGVTGLLIASIFAAGMSTVATSVTSSSTIILTDYYKRFRKNASDKDKKATEDFIKWMVSDEDAKKILSKDMGFAVPFTTFDSEDFQPDNPLTKSALKLESGGLTPIHGAYIPGQAWADGVANALLEYAQGTGDWNGVKKAYLDDWTSAWNDYENNFGMLPPTHK